MQFIATLKEKFNDAKEWCADHKALLLTDAATLACCAGAIGIAVAVSKNEDRKVAEAQQTTIEFEPISDEEEQVMIDAMNDALDNFRNNDELVDETTNEEVNA